MNIEFKSGFVAIVGRPNTGKSTLINALVGEKIAIISDKPQTTRSLIRGMVNKSDYQILIVDTPGIHKPKTALGSRLNVLSKETISEVDVIAVCFPADQKIGPGDKFIVEEIKKSKKPKIALLTKSDLVSKNEILERLHEINTELAVLWQEIMPISSVSLENLKVLEEKIVENLPVSPPLYPTEITTDQTLETRISELIREASLKDLKEELPHSVAVTIDEMLEAESRRGKILKIYASLFVERDSQKSILIGSKGARLKEIGSTARAEIEKLIDQPVFLDLRIKVASEWQSDPKLLSKMGFDQYN
ncbi:MAG: GTPase Era [Candidatus Nanopelagicales bacterium]